MLPPWLNPFKGFLVLLSKKPILYMVVMPGLVWALPALQLHLNHVSSCFVLFISWLPFISPKAADNFARAIPMAWHALPLLEWILGYSAQTPSSGSWPPLPSCWDQGQPVQPYRVLCSEAALCWGLMLFGFRRLY